MKIKSFCLSIAFILIAIFCGVAILDVTESGYVLADIGSGGGSNSGGSNNGDSGSNESASGDINESNIGDYVDPDCNSVADFITQNIETFINEYNNSVYEERDNEENNFDDDEENDIDYENRISYATFVEDRKPVINVTDNTEAVYLDFDGENGYAVIGNNYTMLTFSSTGDLEYLKELDTILFSEDDGFVYETEYGYARYDFEYPDEGYWSEIRFGKFYNGQYRDYGEGSGFIIDPSKYIKSRYGSGYTAMPLKELKGYTNVYQRDYSIYYLLSSSSIKYEGNCTLSAMCGIMQYLRDHKNMSLIPHNTVTVNPANDSFYTKFLNKGYLASNSTVPQIYADIRREPISYGYDRESTAWVSFNMDNIYDNVMYNYGYSKHKSTMVILWSFESQVKKEIDAGYPTMWNTGRGQYGAHSMVVKGYQQFYKQHKIWFIKWKEYKNLMLLNDNWIVTDDHNNMVSDRYFDLDAYGWNLFHEGFGTFLKVR